MSHDHSAVNQTATCSTICVAVHYAAISNTEQHGYQETAKRKHMVVFPL